MRVKLSSTTAVQGRAKTPMLQILRLAEAGLYNAWGMAIVDLPDETATAALAARIAAVAAPADIIALKGDLGTGKTAFARAFIRACGNQDEVPSPTFTLVQVYDAGPTEIWHFDLYRIRAPEEAWELGIEEAFITGISLIEWPERLGPLLPDRRLELGFAFGDGPGARRIAMDPGKGWQERLATIAADA
jgi:tRNA threonylcarbamoyladenosine biosynthesis protein TsaE